MPKAHKYTDWQLGRLRGSKPVYVAENTRPVAEVVRRDSKTVVIKHDKTKPNV